MEDIKILEFHYYFNDNSHSIDATIRNKCEKELLAIAIEACKVLDYSPLIISELPREGGWRDFWTFIDEKPHRVAFILGVITLLAGVPTTIFLNHDPDGDERKSELESLQIEKLKLEIDKLRVTSRKEQKDLTNAVVKRLSGNMKIVKRKSNLYSQLNGYNKISKIGVSVLNDDFAQVIDEKIVERKDFNNFILTSNKLPPIEVDEAEIELISPVLKEGAFRWKGKYNGETITFQMLDSEFKDSITNQLVHFSTGTSIICHLVIDRELDEIGEIRLKEKKVLTVLEVKYNDKTQETLQGKTHRQAKSMSEKQSDFFI